MQVPAPIPHKAVAVITALAGLLALACLVLSALTLMNHPSAFADLRQMLGLPDLNVRMLRWSMLLDMLGFYLFLLPAIYYLQNHLRQQTAWADFITFCGTAYVLIGAIGAAILAQVTPGLLTDYLNATADRQDHIRLLYQTLLQVVYGSLWNLVEVLLGGVWWLLTGWFLRTTSRAFGWTTLVLGAFTALDGLGTLMGQAALASLALNGYFLLAPIWTIWLSVRLWKIPEATQPTKPKWAFAEVYHTTKST
ncbi:hypothetical protein ACFQ4C_21420 [Larkinella insperata]|uniref:DUF4386 domain-containing protein n=1 Tax=Larkinella insperata TaxID=332158 RepID=A0ABW3QHU7_9BACT